MKTRNVAFAVLTAILGASLATQRASAGLVVFTDRAAFEAAVGSFVTEDFNALADADFSTGLNSAGQVDVLIAGAPGANGIRNGATSGLSIDGSPFFRGETDTSPPDVGFPSLSFRSPVIGFGADFVGTLTAGLLTLTIGADTVEFDDFLTGDGDGFLGFVADAPFHKARFRQEDPSNNEQFGLDNLSFAPVVAAVPEPSTLALSGTAALLGLACALRCRRGGTGGR